jgi:hypothetical protein
MNRGGAMPQSRWTNVTTQWQICSEITARLPGYPRQFCGRARSRVAPDNVRSSSRTPPCAQARLSARAAAWNGHGPFCAGHDAARARYPDASDAAGHAAEDAGHAATSGHAATRPRRHARPWHANAQGRSRAARPRAWRSDARRCATAATSWGGFPDWGCCTGRGVPADARAGTALAVSRWGARDADARRPDAPCTARPGARGAADTRGWDARVSDDDGSKPGALSPGATRAPQSAVSLVVTCGRMMRGS